MDQDGRGGTLSRHLIRSLIPTMILICLIFASERAAGPSYYRYEYGQGTPVDINETGAYLRSERMIFHINGSNEDRGDPTVDVISEYVFYNPFNSSISPRILLPFFASNPGVEGISIRTSNSSVDWTYQRYDWDIYNRSISADPLDSCNAERVIDFDLTIEKESNITVFIEYSRRMPYHERGRTVHRSSLISETDGYEYGFYFQFRHVTKTSRYWDHMIDHARYEVWIEKYLLPDVEDIRSDYYNWTAFDANDTHLSFTFEFYNWTPEDNIGLTAMNWEISRIEWMDPNTSWFAGYMILSSVTLSPIVIVTILLYWRQKKRMKRDARLSEERSRFLSRGKGR